MQRRTLLSATSVLPLLGFLPHLTQAQAQSNYPSKPIRYILPLAAGGGADMIARAVCERMGRLLGQPMVVDNLGGGGGVIGSQTTARAVPDGYTLMQAYVGTHGTAPATRKLPYDALRDFTPVGLIGTTPNVLCVNAALPMSDVKGFVDYLRKNPGKVSYGSGGQGSLTHLVAELFKLQTDTFMLHIPYRGIAPAFTDLISGQTQAMFPSLAGGLPHIRSGRIRALAVTGTQRHPLLKDVPTFEEAGLKGFDAQQWYGVMGPAGLTSAVVKQLNEALNKVLSQADFRDKLSSEAVELRPMSPEAFATFVKADIARWSKLAKERNIQLDS
jgi:tripartite-type tricarboxylate transporter receptor subunit TctC